MVTRRSSVGPAATKCGQLPALLYPCDGDVMVERVTVKRGGFTICRASGEPQLWASAYANAVAHATAFGRRARVNVWYVDEGEPIRLVAKHR